MPSYSWVFWKHLIGGLNDPASFQRLQEFVISYNEENNEELIKFHQYEDGNFYVAVSDKFTRRIHSFSIKCLKDITLTRQHAYNVPDLLRQLTDDELSTLK